MDKATKICKVCGREYEYCRTYLPTAFRWQDVACCKEHAIEYFANIEASRATPSNSEPVVEPEVEPKRTKTSRKRSSKSIPEEE